MLETSQIFIVLQLSLDVAGDDKFDRGEGGGNKINLSNLFASKKSTKAGYLIFKSAKKRGGNPNNGGGNIKKNVEANRSSDYLTLDTKKAFNFLYHTFI